MSVLTFQLTRLMRGVTQVLRKGTPDLVFQLTRLMRGVTCGTSNSQQYDSDFNSHASCEA